MTLPSLVYRWAAPDPPYNGELVCLPVQSIPFVLGGLWLRSQKYWWQREDEPVGRKLLAETGAHMLLGCGKDIVDAVNRVYMLIDRNENGTNYTYDTDSETGEVTIFPPIPTVPPNAALYEFPGSKWQREDVRDMLLNALTGTLTADYTNPRGTNPILEEILLALNAEDNAETWRLLGKIVVALGGAV